MRILVADQNALLLAAITATFGGHCEVVTATRRDACLEHAQRQRFDVVIAGDKLVDYTGLELLSEIGGLFPETLLIFAASPARLKRLGSRLQLFGLLETISYPLTPRKLLETLQRARRSLPPKAARPVRHVVLESEWDTGERLGLIEQELENPATESVTHEGWVTQDEGLVHGAVDANTGPRTGSPQIGFETEAALDDFVFAPPPPAPPAPPAVDEDYTVAFELTPSEVPVAQAAEPISNDPIFDQPELPPEPQWAEDGAANDMVYESTTSSGGQSASSRQVSAKPADTSSARKAADVAPRSGDKRPKVRTPTQPTAGQIEAFQRALARRKAEQSGQAGPAEHGNPNTGHATPPDRASWKAASSKSLSELARMAASKRPLPQHNGSGAPPKRAVFMVGSGVAAALVAGVLLFELLRTPSGATEHLARAPVAQAPFAPSSSTLITNNTGPVEAPVFTPPPPPAAPQIAPEQMDGGPSVVNIPPEQTSLDPDGIPEPPPPPALERPGPMEPPSTSSMEIERGPPAGMVPPGFEPEPEVQ